MTSYATNNDGLPIFDINGIPLSRNAAGKVVASDGVTVVATNKDGDPQDGAKAIIAQPTLSVRIAFLTLITKANSHSTSVATYARNPARISTGVINYQSKQGSILYQQGIKSLYEDSKERFALTGDLLGLIDHLNRRSKAGGWSIFDINVGTATAPLIKKFLEEHGQVSLEQLMTYVESYTDPTVALTRDAQEDEQLFQCLMASIDKDAKEVVALRESEYTVNGEYSGVLLLKIIITEAQVDTKSTTTLMWQKLSSGLPDLMAECGSNVKAFNQEVRSIQKKLTARGQDAKTILPQFLAAYSGCDKKDGKFSRYMEQLENSYTDGTVNLDSASLMSKAENKYAELVEKHEFSGSSKKKEDDSLVVLQTEFDTLKALVSTYKSSDSGKTHGKEGGRSNGDSYPTKWTNVAPKDGEPQTKTVGGKEYHWCVGNNAHKPKWVRHDPSKCSGLDDSKKKSDDAKPASESKKESAIKDSKTVKWSSAMRATLSSNEDEDD